MNDDIIINAVSPKVRYVADGTTQAFSFVFPIFTDQDMNVYVNDTLIKSGYSVTGAGSSEGGEVIFNTAPQKGQIITLLRNLEIKRTSDFQESGAFRAKAINHELDYQIACLQQLNEQISRGVSFPPYSETAQAVNLPVPESGKAIVWDTNGISLRNSNLAYDDLEKLMLDTKETVLASEQNVINKEAASQSHEQNAANSKEEARKWAVGTISEQPQGSAKYWAENAKAVTDGTLNETLITNCITKIPQDIKLELSNGTLTLKAGSKAYKGDGSVINITSDLTLPPVGTFTGYSLLYVGISGNELLQVLEAESISGTTPPVGNGAWYDTTEKIVKLYNSGTFSKEASFPIAKVHRTNGTWDLIDQVFNGLGYIGSTIFVLPGVEGLSPNGRNTDGSLNSRKFTSNTVQTINPGTGIGSIYYILSNLSNSARNSNTNDTYIQDEKPDISSLYGVWYSPKENYIRFTNDRGNTWTIANWICLGYYTNDSNGKPSILQNKSVFRAVDYWEYDQDAAKLNKDNTFNGIVTAFTNPINFVAKGKMVKGQTPSGNVFCGYDFQDTNNERLAYLGVNYGSSGTKRLELQKLDSNLTEFSTTFVIKATTPADSASGTEVTTAQWVRKYGAQLDYAKGVTISGNGDKTASSNGVLMINASSQNNQGNEQVTLVVEGQTFYFGNGTVDLDVPHIGQVYFPLKAGQKYNITSPNWSKITAKFFPYA